MDNKTNRYVRGKVFSIRSHQTDDVYIGSTISPLSKRFACHKQGFKEWKVGKKNRYMASYEILKYDDAYIELIEEFNCNSRMELLKQEGKIIRSTENCVNKRIQSRTPKEYRDDNKEKIKEQMGEYRAKNRGVLNQRMRERRVKQLNAIQGIINETAELKKS